MPAVIARDMHPTRIAQHLEGCATRARDAAKALVDPKADLDRDAMLKTLCEDVGLLAQASIALAYATSRATEEARGARSATRRW